MKKLFGLLGLVAAFVTALAVAAPAFADDGHPGTTGFVEICKFVGSPAVPGPFVFTINGGASVTVNANECSAPQQVPAGTATIVETLNSFTKVTNINTSQPGALNSALVSSDLASGTATVNVAAGDIPTETIVNYTDVLVQGQIEVCKSQVAGAGLDGQSFNFELTGGVNAVTSLPAFDQTVAVNVGACSNPIMVPAGTVHVDEQNGATDSPLYVTAITSIAGGALSNPNLTEGSVDVAVAAGGTDMESIVGFQNNSSTLKVCKIGSDPSIVGASFRFAAAPGPISAAGPTSVTAGTAQAPNCIILGRYRAGTRVTVTESPTAGLTVSNVSVDQDPSEIGENSLAPVMGGNDFTGVSETLTMAAGSNVVTFTNSPGIAALLKVCKVGGPVGGTASFTVTGPRGAFPTTTGTSTLSVPIGQCVLVSDASGNPLALPYASNQLITETGIPAGFAVTAIGILPSDRLASLNLAGASVNAFIGDNVTIANFTDSAIPVVTPIVVPPVVITPPVITPAPNAGTNVLGAQTTVPTSTKPVIVTQPQAPKTPGKRHVVKVHKAQKAHKGVKAKTSRAGVRPKLAGYKGHR